MTKPENIKKRAPKSSNNNPPRDLDDESQDQKLMKVYGLNSCLMIAESRPQEVIRAYLIDALVPKFAKLLHLCAQNRKPYRIVSKEELERITQSKHHEGICLVTDKQANTLNLQGFLKETRKKSCLIALEGVTNPHNIGAIIRVCAHFGVDGILAQDSSAFFSSAVFRTAEGGFEHVQVIQSTSLIQDLVQLQESGYKVFLTSSHWGKSLYEEPLAEKTVFVFGSESLGVSDNLRDRFKKTLQIPGSGNVESLNIACSASIFLSKYWETVRK